MSTYTVEVSALLIDTYTIEARDADEAHRAASERANRHLRDDGKMLRVSTIVDDPRADSLPAPEVVIPARSLFEESIMQAAIRAMTKE